jgi:excisionase family DNA binding protein
MNETHRHFIEPDLLPPAQVQFRLNISRTTLWRMTKRGDLPVVPIGSRVLIPRASLERFVSGAEGVEGV